ncbi:MAG: PrsW family intramembrane metalloprotease [Polyangiaceae bacterium]
MPRWWLSAIMGRAIVRRRSGGIGLLVVLVLAVASLGCRFELAGVHDVELVSEVVNPSAPEVVGLVDRIRLRLASAHIASQVTVTDDSRIHVVVDADERPSTLALLRWRGGLSLFAPDTVKNGTIDPKATPLVETSRLASVDTTDWGRAVEIVLDPSLVLPSPDASYAVACNHALLGVAKVDSKKAMVFSSGRDPTAYARADALRRLLSVPATPELHEVDTRALPPDWLRAGLGLVLPLFISLSWLLFVRRFDRAHPEPAWLVLLTFALGGVGVFVAAFVEGAAASLSPWTNPTLMSFGGQTWALPIAILAFAVVVGAVEEGVKLLGVVAFARRRPEFDEPIDGIVYGAAASLGFAAIENVKYFAIGRLSASVIVMRTLTSAPAHLFFGAIWGYALGIRLVSRRRRLPLYFAVAALLHGAFDALLSSRSAAMVVLPLQLGLAATFVVLLRRALRHGAIRDDTIPASALERLRVPLGSRTAFVVWVVLMHAAALAVAYVGLYFETSHQRPDASFFGAALVSLAVFGLSASRVTATLPLDLVVDAQGITFGGSARRWTEIQNVERLYRSLVVKSRAGDLALGPAPEDVLDMAEASIAEGLGKRPMSVRSVRLP